MKKIIIFILFANIACAYDLPIGVPDPGFGLDETQPARPEDWSSPVAGYYYVNEGTGDDTDNTYGTPSAPRATIPDPLPAGSYLELHGTYTTEVGGLTFLRGSGTSDAWAANSAGPVWIVAQDDDNRPTMSCQPIILGDYVYLDGIDFSFGASDELLVGRTKDGSEEDADHIMIRDCTFTGDSTNLQSAISVTSDDVTGDVSYIVLVDLTVSEMGNDTPSFEDQDAHGIKIGGTDTNHVWLLDSDISACSGSGLQVGQDGPAYDATDVQYVYVGNNYIHATRQAGAGVKSSSYVVVTENRLYDAFTRTSGSPSPGKGVGWKDDPDEIWIIFNKIKGSPYGIHGGAVNSNYDIYIIGNAIWDINPDDAGSWDGDNAWNEAAISLVSAVNANIRVIANTIYDVCMGIASPHAAIATVENNIISEINHANGYHLNFQAGTTVSFLHNNFFHDSGGLVFDWGEDTGYTTIAALEQAEADATNNSDADPTFTDTESPTLSLQSGSTAINAGLAATSLQDNVYATYLATFGESIEVDINSVSRPAGNSWDVGAYEYSGSANVTTGAGTTVSFSATGTPATFGK